MTTHRAVDGTDDVSLTTTYTWGRYGTLDEVKGPYASGETPNPTTYVYSATGDLAETTTPLGASSRSAYDTRGNASPLKTPWGAARSASTTMTRRTPTGSTCLRRASMPAARRPSSPTTRRDD